MKVTGVGKVSVVVLVVVAAFLWMVQPWKTQRYGSTADGVAARAEDERILEAQRQDDAIDALPFLGDAPSPSYPYKKMFGGLSYEAAVGLVKDVQAAGSPNQILTFVHDGVRAKTGPEGLAIELPVDAPARVRVIKRMADCFKSIGREPPEDLNQKFVFIRFREPVPSTNPSRPGAATSNPVSG